MALRLSRFLSFRSFRPPLVRKFSDAPAAAEEGETFQEKKGLVLGVYLEPDAKEHTLTAAAQKFDSQTGGKLRELIREGKPLTKGRSSVFQHLDDNFSHVVVVGLGAEETKYDPLENLDEFRENIRIAAGIGTRRLKENSVNHVLVESLGNAEAAAEGAALGSWVYQENKSKEHQEIVPNLELYNDDDVAGWQKGIYKAEAQNLARRLSDTPSNLMTPAIFAKNAVEALCPCGMKVEVRDRDWADSKHMNAFTAVAKGSCEPPVILEIGYFGGSAGEKTVALVGKGVTFDSGGLCLKKCAGMSEFRADMAAAAVIVAVMQAASRLSLPMNIQALIPLCENMPSGMAVKPGDIVQAMSGKSIRIDDTDNEGRLLLADTLAYAYHSFKPKILMDIATLTHGILYALGDSATGVFTNRDDLWEGLSKAGSYTGDRVWRMPLWNHFTKKVTNITSADVTNVGHGPGGGPCRAAAFLREFVPCDADWVHMDIANIGMLSHSQEFPYLEEGRMTGRPTRTLIQFLHQLCCSEGKDKVTLENERPMK